MKLRKRTLIAIGVTFACLVLMLYLVSRVILLGSFAELEEQYARRDVERVLSALSDELAALDTMVFDWAAWDDTYTFIEDANEEYIVSNLVDETFTSPRLNLMLFINSSGQIVFGKGFDLDNEEEISVPQSLQEHLTDDALLRHPDTESSIAGIVLLPEGPLLVASRPILTSEEEGPLRGTMIMGRYLDSAEVERLAEITHVSLSVRRSDDEQMPPDFQAARAAISPSFPQEASVFVQPLSAESVAGYALLNDIYGEPNLMLRVDMPREIYQQGQTSMLYLVFLLMVGGMAFTGMSSLMTDKIVISRLVRLNADVNSIGASGDLSTRVLATGRDELSSLADTINGMLAALEQSDSELRESEERYRLLFNSGNDVVLVSGMTDEGLPGKLIAVNDVACRKLGYTREELLQLSPLDLAAPENWDDFPALAQKFLTERWVLFETMGLAKDGTQIPFEINAHLFDLDAQPAMLSIARDITERKRAEEALRESERRFRDVARTTGDWIWEVDAEGRYTYVSPIVEQVLGYTPAEMLGRHYCDFFHPNEELRVLIQEIFHRKEPFVNLVGSNVHKDGHEVILETSALPLTGAQGNLLGYRGACRDVTAEHRLEERLAMVHALGRELVLSGDEQQVAHAAVDAARFLLRCQLCGLWLVDEERKMLVRRAYYASEQVADITTLPLDGEQGIIVAVARSGEPVCLPDVREDARYVDAGIGTRAELCVSLKVEERVIGVLNVESEKLDAFGGGDRRLLSTLADQAAMAIENARLYEEAEHRLSEARLVQEVMLAAASTLDFDLVLERTVKALHRALGIDRIGFLLPGERDGTLVPHPSLVGSVESTLQILIAGSLVGQVYRTGQPMLVRDLTQESDYLERAPEVCCALAVPVRVGDRVIAVLHAESPRARAFGEDELRLFTTVAGQLGVTLENARLFQREREQREQLRTLTTRLTEAEEAERQRLARELHDQVGQNLTALGLNLNIVRSQMPKETADLVHPRLDDSLALVEQMTERIYGVMADLRPPVLDDYGLMAALRWYSARFASRVNITVTVQGEDPVPRLDAPVENVLFRIAQEALTNVAKHAQATQVTVAVEVEVGSGTVRLVVADDGVGFDPTRVAGPDERLKWGLLTMAERAEGVGGHFRIESSPRRGTRVIVEVAR